VANLIYTAISSVDGYVADAEGNFEWSASDEEVHRFVNDLERPIGTNLSGRRMCEVMRYWEKAPTGDAGPSAEQEYAKIRQTADKIVYSKIIVVGAGNPALPDNVRLVLELLDGRRFSNGVVHLHYRVRV
jgi:RibD C-terminal domain